MPEYRRELLKTLPDPFGTEPIDQYVITPLWWEVKDEETGEWRYCTDEEVRRKPPQPQISELEPHWVRDIK